MKANRRGCLGLMTSAPTLSQALYLRHHVIKIKKLQAQGKKMEIRTVCEGSRNIWKAKCGVDVRSDTLHTATCKSRWRRCSCQVTVPNARRLILLTSVKKSIAISLLLTNQQLHSIHCQPNSAAFACNSVCWTCMQHCSTHSANTKEETTKWRATLLKKLPTSLSHRFRRANEITVYIRDTNTHPRYRK